VAIDSYPMEFEKEVGKKKKEQNNSENNEQNM
jgi:hypothetical protein